MVLIAVTERKDHKKIYGICFLSCVLIFLLRWRTVEDASDICFPSPVPSLFERITGWDRYF